MFEKYRNLKMRKAGEPPRADMIRWFAPMQLWQSSLEVLIAYAGARFVDPRAVFQAAQETARNTPTQLRQRRKKIDLDTLLAKREEIWFDYVADVGDGWNSTYAIARHVAADNLELTRPSHDARIHGSDEPPQGRGLVNTRRGSLLVLGGDLVYPTPGANTYDERLVAPYREAVCEDASDQGPYVLALPGNHDWYDGLRGFRQRFCRPGSDFAGWRTCQWQSYFAVRLPHDVWLIGVDTQLENRINPDQIEYFQLVAEKIEPHHRVILCLPTPDWLEPYDSPAEGIVATMTKILEQEPEVYLAGHRHHYQRHTVIEKPEASLDEGSAVGSSRGRWRRRGSDAAAPDDETSASTQAGETPRRHFITAGGGGAYLSPTHVPLHRYLRNSLHRHASFPPPSESLRYRARLLALPIVEPWFGVIPAIVYGLGACVLHGIHADSFETFLDAAKAEAANMPGFVFLIVLFLSTLMLRQHVDWTSMSIAFLHALAHLTGVLLVAYWVLPSADISSLLPAILAAAVGWVVGAMIVGVYLWLASRLDRFVDVGYASLRIDDWKSFLRFHLDRDGMLTIYPIGLRRVPRAWSCRDGKGLSPEDPRATEPELIEMPIVIAPKRAQVPQRDHASPEDQTPQEKQAPPKKRARR